MELLNINGRPYNETSIEGYEFRTYPPYVQGNLNYNDELRIAVQEMDAFTAPCNRFLYVEGKLTKADGHLSANMTFINNGIAHIFREIRYEFNGVIIDSLRNVDIATTLKSYLSFGENESNMLKNTGWFPNRKENEKILVDRKGNFNACR